MKFPKIIHGIALLMLIIGGLNWGLVGAFNYNLVTQIAGDGTQLTQVIYVLVGIAAIVEALISISR